MKRIKLLWAAVFFIVMACGASDDKVCPDASCDDYLTQSEAQMTFDANKECLGELDNDNDGIACEQISSGGGGGTGCPTTGNCGCSNKTKAQCASACCQWIVGTGCKCK